MYSLIGKYKDVLTGITLGMLACANAIADDTEVYVARHSGLSAKPNVLLILDNSGSMSDNALYAPVDYDPGQTYSGSFAAGFYYWTIDATIPTDPSTDQKVAVTNFHCNTGDAGEAVPGPLDEHGIFTDKVLAYRPAAKSWRQLRYYSSGEEDIECANDSGVHGNGGASLHAVDGKADPWGGKGDEVVWDEFSTNYTFYAANFLNYNALVSATDPIPVSASDPTDPVCDLDDDAVPDPDPDNNMIVCRTRFETMVYVVNQLLRRISNVNIGLMWFRSFEGGYVEKEIVGIDDFANRQALIAAINSAPDRTHTPLSEVLYEAFLYYSGGEIDYGDQDEIAGDTTDNESIDAARTVAKDRYKSPIKYECQKNYNLMMTDGLPTRDQSADPKIEDLKDFQKFTGSKKCDRNGYGKNGHCLDQISHYMNGEVESTGETIDFSPTLDGEQNIQTHAIGFLLQDADLLKTTAQLGGGTYTSANDADDLATAFAELLEPDQIPSAATFTAPSVSVSAFNRTLNREFLYYTMFLPGEAPRWDGNLKKYRLVFGADGVAKITDSSTVVPPPDVISNGAFKATAKSFWSDETDGNDVLIGGARDELTDAMVVLPPERNLWTFTGGSTILSAPDNEVVETNTALTRELLGVGTDDLRDEIIQWMRGVDVLDEDGDTSVTDSRRSIGDPLHSQPAIVTYGGDEGNPEQVIFIATNDGLLHAIDELTGKEIFSFIPQELLKLQPELYRNLFSTERSYGLDGSITTWVYDENKDGVIDPNNDHVYLYVGMRRGGNNYYALDVTKANLNSPSASLLWKIVDGNLIVADPDDATTTTTTEGTIDDGLYSVMGQTWSRPLVRNVKIGTQEKTVLVVGGGYDTNQDSVLVTTSDNLGHAVYFIDAETGSRLWWASESAADLNLTSMAYGIPSEIAAFDITGDGLLDRMYVGDMGAQLWRFDIENGNGTTDLVKGGVIASLGGSGEAGARRFYSPPDVALVVEPSGAFLSLVIGSGYRAHPLDVEIEDRLYMIRDHDIYQAPDSYTTVKESDLYDATLNNLGQSTGSTLENARKALKNSEGWYVQLDSGEKSLAPSLILGGVAIMTTFTPTSESDPCKAPGGGLGHVYYMNLSDATPLFNLDHVGNDSELTSDDRSMTLASGGIPSEPVHIIGKDSDGNLASAVLHDKEQGFDPTQNAPIKTYWYEQ